MSPRGRRLGLGLLLLALGALAGAPLGWRPAVNFGPAILALGVLVLGFDAGWRAVRAATAFAALYTLGLLALGWARPEEALGGLAAQLALVSFPPPFAEEARRAERSFRQSRAQLLRQRRNRSRMLAGLRAHAQELERSAREVEALYQAGRELGRLLGLEDSLDYARVSLLETLPRGGSPRPAFALSLAEEGQAPRTALAEGLGEERLQELADPAFAGRLRPAGGGWWGAEEAGRRWLAWPLSAPHRVLGWILLPWQAGPEEALPDPGKLRILASQLAIGLERARLWDQVQRLSVTDSLTGLAVHRHFQARLEEELRRAERYREPLSLLMADVDHFKAVNDRWGHAAGDAVLQAVAAELRRGLGPGELAARYGGEEFALLLPRLGLAAALERAEELRLRVRGLSVQAGGGTLGVTLSLGAACFPEQGSSRSGLIEAADRALYRSKAAGRDRVSAPPAAA